VPVEDVETASGSSFVQRKIIGGRDKNQLNRTASRQCSSLQVCPAPD
jgi:hypothetical protein